MVPHEHCTDWAGQGCSQFYTRRIQRNFLIQLSGCVKIARVPCREISHLYAAQAARLRWNFPHKMPSHPSPHSGIRASSLDFITSTIWKSLFVFLTTSSTICSSHLERSQSRVFEFQCYRFALAAVAACAASVNGNK